MTGLSTIYAFVRRIVPAADRALAGWRALAARSPDPRLARLALASLDHKRFHAQGGAVFALQALQHRTEVLEAIVALQTISDYLDNLCDRAGCADENAFRLLHRAMIDAVTVDGAGDLPDYYAAYPPPRQGEGDGGYLAALVRACRLRLAALPSYRAVQAAVLHLVGLYADLQVYKHLPRREREPRLLAWFHQKRPHGIAIEWWEFAAATGSTLGVFALFAAAARPECPAAAVDRLAAAYFPWICGLHILLDYFIDQAEDEAGGDLNFIRCYPSPAAAQRGLLRFVRAARAQAARLADAPFHLAITRGLLALYLSDPKVRSQGFGLAAAALLRAGGLQTRGLYWGCRLLRRRGVLGPLHCAVQPPSI